MSAVGNASSFAPTKPIVAPPKQPEMPGERMRKQAEIKREVAYQLAKSKPKEERTDKDKQVIAAYHINNVLNSPMLDPKSAGHVMYLA